MKKRIITLSAIGCAVVGALAVAYIAARKFRAIPDCDGENIARELGLIPDHDCKNAD